MPRQATVRERTRRQVDDRETFDFTTPNMKVSANPVDPYAKPGAPPQVLMSGDVKAFQAIMGNLQDALAGGQKIKKDYDKREQKRGGADAAAGRKDEDPGEAYLIGHEIISGKAAAGDLEKQSLDYYEKNKDVEPLQFKVGMERLQKQFLLGRSEAFVEGIMADAINIEQKYNLTYHHYTTKRVKEDGLANIAKGFDYDIQSIAADTSTTREDKAKAIREMFTGAQALGGMTYGLTKNEVSDHLINVMSRKALELGDPDLMKFAWVGDKDGIRLVDNPKLAANIEQGVKVADNEKATRTNEFDKRVLKLQKDVENRVGNNIAELLVDGNADTKAAYEMLRQYSDPSRNKEGVMLTPSFVEHSHRLIANRGAGFALQSDPEVYASAMDKAGRGELSLSDIRGLKSHMEEGEWKSVLALNIREQNSAGVRTPGRKDFDSKLSTTITSVKAVDPLTGRFLDPNGPKRAIFVNTEARDWFAQYAAENKGAEPPKEMVNEKLKLLAEDSFKFYESQDFDGKPAPPPSSGMGAVKGSKPALDNQSGGPRMKTDVGTDLGSQFDALEKKKQSKK